jgi:hypothetical protein
MPSDPVATTRADLIAALRRGFEWSYMNKEEDVTVRYDAATGTFVEEEYDPLLLGRQTPVSVTTISAAAALARVGPREDTPEAWAAALRRLRAPDHAAYPGALDIDLSTLVFAGTLPDGTEWRARAEAVDVVPMLPVVHVRVEAGGGLFFWTMPARHYGAWRAEGHAAFEAALVTSLVRRLAEGRLLDFTAPSPLPGGGIWTARMEDHYADLGVGFAITVTLPDGAVHTLHHQLAAPDATRLEAAKIAARSRMTKWIARRLRG